MDSFRGRLLAFREGNREKRAAFVGALGSLDFDPQLRDFVLEVDRIKRLASPA
jgi:xanthine/CO dehydrogenase XdhC/CoxF family maturation factor